MNAPLLNAKVAQILRAARLLFMELGYGGTSMDAVARQAGVSKSTLYARFDGKEPLFRAVILEGCRDLHGILAAIPATGERGVPEILRHFGLQFLRFVTDPDIVTLLRVTIAESRQFPQLGAALYESGTVPVVSHFAGMLRGWSEEGLLAIPDPDLAAREFFALAKKDLQFRCLLTAGKPPTDAEICGNVESAVTMFLDRYGAQLVP